MGAGRPKFQRGEASEYALAETRLALRGTVKKRFYEVLRHESLLEVARGNLDLVEDLRRRIEMQVKVGEAARLELTRAAARSDFRRSNSAISPCHDDSDSSGAGPRAVPLRDRPGI